MPCSCYRAVTAFLLAGVATCTTPDDVFEALDRLDLGSFIKTLQAPEVHVNAPSAQGQLPIVQAVAAGHEFVEVALFAGALVDAREKGTGRTALLAAMEHKDPEAGQLTCSQTDQSRAMQIARTLIAHGAKPDYQAPDGTSPRKLAEGHPDLELIVQVFDEEGCVAFEDPPGSWTEREDQESGHRYFHNVDGAVVPHRVPSLAWTIHVTDEHITYQNRVTHQVLWRCPDALAWRQLRGESGRLFWYNYRTNLTMWNQPAELHGETVGAMQELSKHFWVNSVTRETTHDEPHASAWKQFKNKVHNTYYFYNTKTHETSSRAPDELMWKHTLSREHDDTEYWFNKRTKESSWTMPVHLAWHRHSVP